MKGSRHENKDGVSGSSVIAKYIQRFRSAPPSSPHERRRSPERKQQIEQDFWWSSSKSSPRSPYSKHSHGAISSPPSVSRSHKNPVVALPQSATPISHPWGLPGSTTTFSQATETTTRVETSTHPTAAADAPVNESHDDEIAKAPQADESRLEWSHDLSTEELLRAIDITDRKDEEYESELMFREEPSFRSLERRIDLSDDYIRHREELTNESRYSYLENTPPGDSRLWDSDMEWLKRARTFIDDSRAKSTPTSLASSNTFTGQGQGNSCRDGESFRIPSSRLPVLRARVEKFRIDSQDNLHTSNGNTFKSPDQSEGLNKGHFEPSSQSTETLVSGQSHPTSLYSHGAQQMENRNVRSDSCGGGTEEAMRSSTHVPSTNKSDAGRRAELAARYEAVFPRSLPETPPSTGNLGTEPNSRSPGTKASFGNPSLAFATQGHAFSRTTVKRTPQLRTHTAPMDQSSNVRQNSAPQVEVSAVSSRRLTVEKTVNCTVDGSDTLQTKRTDREMAHAVTPASSSSTETSELPTTLNAAEKAGKSVDLVDAEFEDSMYIDPSILANEDAERTIQRLRERLRNARDLHIRRRREKRRQIIDAERRPSSPKVSSPATTLLRTNCTHDAIPSQECKYRTPSRVEFCGSVLTESVAPYTSLHYRWPHSSGSETSIGESMKDSSTARAKQHSCLDVQRCEHIHITPSTISHNEVIVWKDSSCQQASTVTSQRYNLRRCPDSPEEMMSGYIQSDKTGKTGDETKLATINSSVPSPSVSSVVDAYVSEGQPVSYIPGTPIPSEHPSIQNKDSSFTNGLFTQSVPNCVESADEVNSVLTSQCGSMGTASELQQDDHSSGNSKSRQVPSGQPSSHSSRPVEQSHALIGSYTGVSKEEYNGYREFAFSHSASVSSPTRSNDGTISKAISSTSMVTHTGESDIGSPVPSPVHSSDQYQSGHAYTTTSSKLEVNESTWTWTATSEEPHLRMSAPTSLSASISFDVSSDEETESNSPSRDRQTPSANVYEVDASRCDGTSEEVADSMETTPNFSSIGEVEEIGDLQRNSTTRESYRDGVQRGGMSASPDQYRDSSPTRAVISNGEYANASVSRTSESVLTETDFRLVKEQSGLRTPSTAVGSGSCTAPSVHGSDDGGLQGPQRAPSGTDGNPSYANQGSGPYSGVSTPSSIALEFDPVYRSLLERVSQIVPLPEENAFDVEFASTDSSVPSAPHHDVSPLYSGVGYDGSALPPLDSVNYGYGAGPYFAGYSTSYADNIPWGAEQFMWHTPLYTQSQPPAWDNSFNPVSNPYSPYSYHYPAADFDYPGR
eukprot:gb/GECG01011321.1/.p1 GENE.gb/GECG01011321.1/~~gb/GECG01011321.1/.p1  ORF type:complete len:1307 (+),score=180.66 gb/GECG01011321.1/:1-3921(+)